MLIPAFGALRAMTCAITAQMGCWRRVRNLVRGFSAQGTPLLKRYALSGRNAARRYGRNRRLMNL